MSIGNMNLRSLMLAPHRMFFTTGLAYLVLVSGWWLAVQVARTWFGAGLEPLVPGLISHGAMMLFLVFTPFMFGFLITVFPRWQPAPALPHRLCQAAFALMILALPLLLAGVYLDQDMFLIGWLLYLSGWTLVLGGLFSSWLVARQTVSHSQGVLIGLATGLAAALMFAWVLVKGRFDLWPYVRSFGLWGFLVTVFFTVCHRMVPFFTSCVIKGYEVWRPDWMLRAFVLLALARAALEVHPEFSWVPTFGMSLIALVFAIRWRPQVKHGSPLLSVLHISFAWLVIGLLLQLGQDLGMAIFNTHWLGRAPLHALTLGFLGGMLLSMITRVTMGHSGRPLALDRVGWWIFLMTQFAAVARVAAEMFPFTAVWLTLLAASVWFLALAAWAAKYGPVFFQPRIDGQPG